MVLKNQLIYLVNVKTKREIFFKLCVLVRKSKLYLPRVVQGGVLEVLQWKTCPASIAQLPNQALPLQANFILPFIT